jgi:hypothetical protein
MVTRTPSGCAVTVVPASGCPAWMTLFSAAACSSFMTPSSMRQRRVS